jgi:hypothetical protein
MMRRIVLALFLTVAPLAFWAAAGCSETKTTTYDRQERIEESEPRMVSPGEPVVE